MQTKAFGRTGLELSRLTFGCGAVGGLMTKGAATDQDPSLGRETMVLTILTQRQVTAIRHRKPTSAVLLAPTEMMSLSVQKLA